MAKKRKSGVWLFFERDGNCPKKAKCKLCGRAYATGGGTSNLQEHLKRQHKKRVEELHRGETAANTNNTAAAVACEDQKPSVNVHIDDALRKFVVSDMQPFDIVDNVDFQMFVKSLNPGYSIPCRRALAEDVLDTTYNSVQDRLCTDLATVKSVALTTDTWTSTRQEFCLALTAHFIKDEKLVSACLECCALKENHTADDVAAVLTDIVTKWGIQERVTAIVTDSDANMAAAVESLSMRHLPCVAHALDQVLADGFGKTPAIVEILDHCANIATYFKENATACSALLLYRQSAGKSASHLVQHVHTRWNSKLEMAQRLLEVKEELLPAQSTLVNAPRTLTGAEWRVLQEMVDVASPLESMITVLTGEQYVTCSNIIPLSHGLLLELKKRKSAVQTVIGQQFADEILKATTVRLTPYETQCVSKLATFLDPRFKKLAFQSPEHADEAETLAECEVTAFLQRQQEDDHQPESHEGTSNSFGGGLLCFMAEKVSRQQTASSAATDAKICVRQYVEKPPELQTANPIRYWSRENQRNGISDVALWYMCVPATSVPAERIFSKAGQIIASKRNCLCPESANKMIFLHGNKHYLN